MSGQPVADPTSSGPADMDGVTVTTGTGSTGAPATTTSDLRNLAGQVQQLQVGAVSQPLPSVTTAGTSAALSSPIATGPPSTPLPASLSVLLSQVQQTPPTVSAAGNQPPLGPPPGLPSPQQMLQNLTFEQLKNLVQIEAQRLLVAGFQAGVAAVAKDDAGETSPGAGTSKGVNKRKVKSEATGGNTDASSRRAKAPKVSFEELAVQYDRCRKCGFHHPKAALSSHEARCPGDPKRFKTRMGKVRSMVEKGLTDKINDFKKKD